MTADELRELCKAAYTEAIQWLEACREADGRTYPAETYLMMGIGRMAGQVGVQLEVFSEADEQGFAEGLTSIMLEVLDV